MLFNNPALRQPTSIHSFFDIHISGKHPFHAAQAGAHHLTLSRAELLPRNIILGLAIALSGGGHAPEKSCTVGSR